MSAVKWAGLALFVAAVSAGCASTPPVRAPGDLAAGDYQYLRDRMTWEIEQAIDDRDLASVAIAVVDGDKIVWEQGFGKPDPDKAAKASPDTVYRVGSVSKLFTYAAIMRLAQEGKVDLDAPLSTYIPELHLLPPPGYFEASSSWEQSQIRVRDLMTHHAGIPGDRFKNFLSENPADFRELPTLLSGWHATHPPGVALSYSNNAVALLGIVVERTTGLPFEQVTTEWILRPAGMPTAAWALNDTLRPRYAPPHEGEVKTHYDISARPAGSLYASVHEMAQFAKVILAGGMGADSRILEEETLHAMWQRQNADVALDFDQAIGLGWFLDAVRIEGSQGSVFHNGATLYHRASFLVLPHEQLAVVVLSNSGNSKTDSIARLAANVAVESKLGVRRQEREATTPASGPPLSAAELDRWAGYWDTGLGAIHLQRDDDELTFDAVGQTFDLVPTTANTSTLDMWLFGFIPFTPAELKKLELRFKEVEGSDVVVVVEREPNAQAGGPDVEREQLFGSRVNPVAFGDVWKERFGEWSISEASAEGDAPIFSGLKIGSLDALLVVSILPVGGQTVPFALTPVSDDEAVISGIGRNKGDFIRFVRKGSAEVMIWSGYELRRLP